MSIVPSLWTWVPRTGGTSLWEWLCGHSRMEAIGCNVFHFADLNVMATKHWPPEGWGDFAEGRHVFGVSRDPFYRASSLASYCGFKTVADMLDHMDGGGLPIRMEKYPDGMNFGWPQWRWLKGAETILRLERVNRDIGLLAVQLGWPECRLNRYNRSKPLPLTTSDVRRVCERYAEDFARLNYRKEYGA